MRRGSEGLLVLAIDRAGTFFRMLPQARVPMMTATPQNGMRGKREQRQDVRGQ